MRWKLGFFVSLLLTLGCSEPNHQDLGGEFRERVDSINRQTGSRLISSQELQLKLANGERVLLLDIREADEFETSSLKSALLVPPDSLNELELSPDEETLIVTYCTVGYRSGTAAVELEKVLHRPVFNLDGGLIEWFNQGGEVVDPAGNRVDRIHPYDSDWERYVRRSQQSK